MPPRIERAHSGDLTELAAVAAATFPLACPRDSPPSEIATFIDANLTAARFAEYLDDPDRTVFVAREGRILGYTMVIRGEPTDPDVRRAVVPRPAIELSKMYVLPEAHGTGAAHALMNAALDHAREQGARCVWLGVNQENQRAQRFYAKHGYAVAGTKTFRLGGRIENDYVMIRDVLPRADANSPDSARIEGS